MSTLVQPNNQVPLLVDPVTGIVQLPPDQAAGAVVCAELKTTGTLYTVPSGKTFYGALVILAAGPAGGNVTVTDANAVVWASVGSPAPGPLTPSVIGVTIAGGGGNALTVGDTGSGAPVSVLLAGYVK